MRCERVVLNGGCNLRTWIVSVKTLVIHPWYVFLGVEPRASWTYRAETRPICYYQPVIAIGTAVHSGGLINTVDAVLNVSSNSHTPD